MSSAVRSAGLPWCLGGEFARFVDCEISWHPTFLMCQLLGLVNAVNGVFGVMLLNFTRICITRMNFTPAEAVCCSSDYLQAA